MGLLDFEAVYVWRLTSTFRGKALALTSR